MQEPLVSQLGYLGNTRAASQILNGTFICPPELETETQLFISALRVTSLAMMANKVSTSVTKEDFKSYWKHAHVVIPIKHPFRTLQGINQIRLCIGDPRSLH
jgi:hypothetical protein